MYVELIILLNIFIHVILVYSTALILKVNIKKRFIIISSILDIIYTVIYIYYPEYIFYIRNFFGFILGFISFIHLGKKSITCMFLYVGLNMLKGGEALFLNNIISLTWISLILLFIISFIILYLYKLSNRFNFDSNNLFYDLIIIYKNNKYIIKCFLDTGNFLVSEDLLNIIFISDKYFFGKKKKSIESKSIGVCNNLDLYEVDKIYLLINGKYKRVYAYIAFGSFKYDGMFGLGLLGG